MPLTWSVMSDSEPPEACGHSQPRFPSTFGEERGRHSQGPTRPETPPTPVRNNRREGVAGLEGFVPVVIVHDRSSLRPRAPARQHWASSDPNRGSSGTCRRPIVPVTIDFDWDPAFQKLPKHMRDGEDQEPIIPKVVQQPLSALPVLVNRRPPRVSRLRLISVTIMISASRKSVA